MFVLKKMYWNIYWKFEEYQIRWNDDIFFVPFNIVSVCSYFTSVSLQITLDQILTLKFNKALLNIVNFIHSLVFVLADSSSDDDSVFGDDRRDGRRQYQNLRHASDSSPASSSNSSSQNLSQVGGGSSNQQHHLNHRVNNANAIYANVTPVTPASQAVPAPAAVHRYQPSSAQQQSHSSSPSSQQHQTPSSASSSPATGQHHAHPPATRDVDVLQSSRNIRKY